MVPADSPHAPYRTGRVHVVQPSCTCSGVNVTPLYACVMGDPGRHVDDAVAEAHAALARVRAMPGSQDKSDAAARLMREMREVSDAASAVLRAEMLRVYDEEGLS